MQQVWREGVTHLDDEDEEVGRVVHPVDEVVFITHARLLCENHVLRQQLLQHHLRNVVRMESRNRCKDINIVVKQNEDNEGAERRNNLHVERNWSVANSNCAGSASADFSSGRARTRKSLLWWFLRRRLLRLSANKQTQHDDVLHVSFYVAKEGHTHIPATCCSTQTRPVRS